ADPLRWETAEKARSRGEVTASPPFLLLEEAGKADAQPVVGLYHPVYREADPESSAERKERLMGFAMAGFRPDPILAQAASDAEATDLGLVLTDPEATGALVLAQRPRRASEMPRREGFALKLPVRLADRTWSLSVFALPGGLVSAWRGAIITAVAGLLTVL